MEVEAKMDSNIRPEAPDDYARVHEITKLAYESEGEANLVNTLRTEAKPVISLVAEVDGQVVGHILFTPVAIGDTPANASAMGLAPLSVHPDFQEHGIGGALVKAGLEACTEESAEVVVTLGHPEYYSRHGFTPAVEEGISYVGRDFDPFFMVIELSPGALENFQGEVNFHDAFDEL
ncbi:MAG: putative acetyltransferase [Candidatus Krumholzibacteriia bacterium]